MGVIFLTCSVAISIIRKRLFLSFFISGRGGQSALRFARLRMEKRHNYVRKVAETAVQLFVSNDKVNVAGMVLAGSADFKTELSQSDMFDPVCVLNAVTFFGLHFLTQPQVCRPLNICLGHLSHKSNGRFI